MFSCTRRGRRRQLLALIGVIGTSLIGAALVQATDFPDREIADVADFDRNGTLDLLLTDRGDAGGDTKALYVVSRQADGSFAPEIEVARDASLVGFDVSVAAADFDGDGWTDVAWTYADPAAPSQSIYTAAGGAGGRLGAPVQRSAFPAGVLVNELAAGDLTGDGLPDLLATSDTGVYLAPGQRAVSPVAAPTRIAGAPGSGKALIVRVDGSSPQVYLESTAGPVVRLTKGAGGAWTSSPDLSEPVEDFAVGDLDGDRLPDLVTIEPKSVDLARERVLARLGRPSNDFGSPEAIADAVTQDGEVLEMRSVAIGDADGIERPDVLLARRHPTTGSIVDDLILFAGRGSGGFYDAERVSVDNVGLISGEFLRLIDLDGRPPAEVVFSGNPSGVRAGSGQVKTSRPNLVVSAPSSSSVMRGKSLALPVSIANPGARDATGATLQLALPPGLVPDETPPECAATSPGLSCRLGTVASGTTRQVRIAVLAQAAGNVMLSLKARASEPDVNSADNDLTVSVDITDPPTGGGSPPNNPPNKGIKRFGTAKADTLRGTQYADVLDGLAGADRIFGIAGSDILIGGAGKDTIDAGKGNDTIRARDKTRDVILCRSGTDTVIADKADVLTGCEKVIRR
jgi:Ca2+-binding RTX toxin-like protein